MFGVSIGGKPSKVSDNRQEINLNACRFTLHMILHNIKQVHTYTIYATGIKDLQDERVVRIAIR